MVTVVTREANGIPLTHDQVDDNFTALAAAVNSIGADVIVEAVAAKDVAVSAANSASASANSASNSANAASISSGSAATSAEQAAISQAAAAASAGSLSGADGASHVGSGVTTVQARLDLLDEKIAVPMVARQYNDINTFLDATTGPISIRVPEGRFAAPAPSKMREGVAIVGDVMPAISASGDRLEKGSVLEGTFAAKRLNNVELFNIGLDRGTFVRDSKFSGVNDNAVVITNWDGVAGNIYPQLIGCRIGNVIGLIPTTTTGSPVPYHGVLLEGFGASCSIGNIDGYGGIASVVVKGTDIPTGTLSGSNGVPYTVAIKSNNYANCNNLMIPMIRSRNGGGVAIVSDDATVGYQLSRVWIGAIDEQNCQYGVRTDSTTGQPISDIYIGYIRGRGIVGVGANIKGANTSRVSIGAHYFEGCGIGAVVTDSAVDCSIGDGRTVGCTGYGYQIDVAGTKAGNIFASDTSGGAGIVTNTPDFTALSAAGSGNAGGTFGGTHLPLTVSASVPVSVSAASGITVGDAIQLTSSDRYRVDVVRGALSAASITNGTVLCTIPAQFRPLADKLMLAVGFAGATFSPQAISISSSDGLVTYRGATVTNVYLNNISYDRR